MRRLTKRLSIEEHREIGAELKRIREYLIRLSCKIPNTYGKTDRAAQDAIRSYDKVDDLRSLMESHLFKDCPDDANVDIYYGKTVVPDPPKPPPRPFWWSQRCCDKAKQGSPCVCAFNTVCPDHGAIHHGTHD